MELLATGFNAWNQLGLEEQAPLQENPDDVVKFTIVLSGDTIERPFASISCTVVNTATGIISAGYPDDWMQLPDLRAKVLLSTAAVAGNGVIVVFDQNQSIHQYKSATHLQSGKIQQSFSGLRNVVQIVAYETGFAALLADGKVWTWGDERYGACLGRDVSETSPAETPYRVVELEDLPTGRIKKLAAGGYLLLALTEGNDLYGWGGHPGRPAIIEDVSGDPTPLLVEENDIADCAVGESHAVVLTSEGEIYVIGDNANGQLGIAAEKVASWTKVPINLAPGSSISHVACGPRNSFVLVNKNTNKS